MITLVGDEPEKRWCNLISSTNIGSWFSQLCLETENVSLEKGSIRNCLNWRKQRHSVQV